MSDISSHQNQNEPSLREIVDRYTRYWYLFVLGVIIAVTATLIYLRYSTSYYMSTATVIVKDDRSANNSGELAAFSELGSFLNRFGDNKIENELAVFRSKRIIKEAVKTLDLNIVYESIGTFKNSNLYEHRPFEVRYLNFNDSVVSNRIPKLNFEILSETSYEVWTDSKSIEQTHDFGEKVELPFGDITVLPIFDKPEIFDHYIGKTISVTYQDIDRVASSFQNRVKVVNEIKSSNVVILSLQSPVRAQAEDFIDELVFQYNKDAINDRGQVAKKTSDFIDSRLEIITRELDSVETNKEQFKSENRLTNIEAEAQLILQNASEFEKRRFDVTTQLELANTMIDYMESSSSNDLLPANIGLSGEEVSRSVNNYNELILRRNELLKTSTSKNPVVINLNNQIEDIRSGILGSLTNTTSALKISLRDLNFKEASINSKLSQVPTTEKIYRGIERQQTIKEQLYLFLLQQREKANISLAVTAPKAKVVDKAFSSSVPVSPNKPLILLGGVLLGLLFPFLIIYVRSLLNNRVANRRDVEQMLPEVSLIGEIPRLGKGEEQLIQLNDRSILAESFRILRTNLQYLFINKLNKEKDANTVFVTSTIKGEGKTFVAFNLALTLALTGKKVALIGADIRNPQLQRYLPKESQSRKGLTEYIIDNTLTLKDLAAKSSYNENLSIVLSGVIPPNPAELLMEARTSEFFDEAREMFDYVIVDTAPSMLVTDTILINKLADVTLYVARANYTERKLLGFAKDAIDDGRLVNVATVLNNVSMINFGYGNKYGYSYTEEQRGGILRRIFR